MMYMDTETLITIWTMVAFLDYNEILHLRKRPNNHVYLACQAVECQFKGFAPTDLDWTDAALERLDRLSDQLSVVSTKIKVRSHSNA